MRSVFLDTEFTQFRAGRMLSLGLVADDGAECYVEIADPARHARASDFCRHRALVDARALRAAWLAQAPA